MNCATVIPKGRHRPGTLLYRSMYGTAVVRKAQPMGTRTDRIKARVAPERADRIRRAAELVHQSVSSFVIDATEEKAERIILEQRETTVPTSFFDELLAALDKPAT